MKYVMIFILRVMYILWMVFWYIFWVTWNGKTGWNKYLVSRWEFVVACHDDYLDEKTVEMLSKESFSDTATRIINDGPTTIFV